MTHVANFSTKEEKKTKDAAPAVGIPYGNLTIGMRFISSNRLRIYEDKVIVV